MKTTLALFAFLLAGVLPMSAQGTFAFINNEATKITNALTGMPAGGVQVGAYYSTITNYASDQNSSFLLPISTAITNTLLAGASGIFLGGVRQIPGVAEGSYIALQIRAWTGAYVSYEDAYLGALGGDASVLLGGSRVFVLGPIGRPIGAPSGVITPVITGAGKLNGININVVPEPTTYALAVLGTAILTFCTRRRKR